MTSRNWLTRSSTVVAVKSSQLHLFPWHTFSKGFRLGELSDRLMTWKLCLSLNHWVKILALWHWSPILKKVCCLMLVHKKHQLVLQQLLGTDFVHHLLFLEELRNPCPLKLKHPKAVTLGEGECLTVLEVNLVKNWSDPFGLLQWSTFKPNCSSNWLSVEKITSLWKKVQWEVWQHLIYKDCKGMLGYTQLVWPSRDWWRLHSLNRSGTRPVNRHCHRG